MPILQAQPFLPCCFNYYSFGKLLTCPPHLDIVSLLLQDLVVEATQSMLSSYKSVQNMADTVLKRAAKQYPCLVQPLLPFLLSALAGLPLPSRETLRATLDGPDAPHGQELLVDVGFVRQLCEKASQAVGSETATAEVSAAGTSLC